MIKISANISKKVPIPGLDFSSQNFGAAIEIEVSDSDKPEAIQARIHELYGLLSNSIDSQITGVGQNTAVPQPQPQRLAAPQPQNQQQQAQRPQYNGNGSSYNGRNRIANNVNTNAAPNTNGNGNGNSRRVTCTEAQAKCIFAICKAQNLDMAAVLADYNVTDARDLHVRDASRLIDQLKKNNNGTPAQ